MRQNAGKIKIVLSGAGQETFNLEDELSTALRRNNVPYLLQETTKCLGWFYTRIINDSSARPFVTPCN